jgi:hypothetical protein
MTERTALPVRTAEGACDGRADPQFDLPLRRVPVANGERVCVEYDVARGGGAAGGAIQALVAQGR